MTHAIGSASSATFMLNTVQVYKGCHDGWRGKGQWKWRGKGGRGGGV